MERMGKYTITVFKSIEQCAKIIFCEIKKNIYIYRHFIYLCMCVCLSIYVFTLLNIFQKATKKNS